MKREDLIVVKLMVGQPDILLGPIVFRARIVDDRRNGIIRFDEITGQLIGVASTLQLDFTGSRLNTIARDVRNADYFAVAFGRL